MTWGRSRGRILSDMADELVRTLRARWDELLSRCDDDQSWVGQALRPVIAAASASSQLRALFPFTSLNRLCFSRCSDYPYTGDCPCIVATAGDYVVLATWFVSDEPAPELLTTTDLDEAISTVVEHVAARPAPWLGDRDHQPQ